MIKRRYFEFITSKTSNTVSLLCSVSKIEGNVLYAEVINGHWPIAFNMETGGNFRNKWMNPDINFIRAIGPFNKGDYDDKLSGIQDLMDAGQEFPIKTNLQISDFCIEWEEDDVDEGFDDSIPF